MEMTLIIVQARLTSKRFPRKILFKIKNKTILQHVIDKAKRACNIDKIVVASPHYINFTGAERYIYTGDENDVLGRFYHCARKYGATTIVRITADCPLIDHVLIDKAIDYFRLHEFSYTEFAPVSGFDVEVFSFKMLKEAHFSTKNPYDREHVTPYMQRVSKLSIDTKKDLKKVKKWLNR